MKIAMMMAIKINCSEFKNPKTNLWLWGIGTLLFFLGQLNTHPIRVSEALFLSINAWSAGYYAISMQTISQVSIFVSHAFLC